MQWPILVLTACRATAATAVMAGVGFATLGLVAETAGLAGQLARVALPLGVSVLVYCGVYVSLGGRELAILLGHGTTEHDRPA